ncbi:hypothetical protein L226DRAFT_312225 [Lentinus tigrinus ALCF2SS1-7]|uniref:Uncharacterized protein n=1 Tax=Lentinus tigrinus ALCF2SS1-6 TaxID=1328759 RepID=A0A5C2RUB3_9APHY|nr:hypothetical protein L227DRAFT_370291 [Lentinus tigrinus ALCF2SS1-6]RPD68861.1 hypothetical protein L226DRAFT_312225 [Lentinus tigrinus ALCF2SS1-7]
MPSLCTCRPYTWGRDHIGVSWHITNTICISSILALPCRHSDRPPLRHGRSALHVASGATRCIPVPVDEDPFGLRGRAAQAGRGEPCAGHGMLHVSSARFHKRPPYVHLNHCFSHIRKSSAATLKLSNNQGLLRSHRLRGYDSQPSGSRELTLPRATVAILSSSAARPYLK